VNGFLKVSQNQKISFVNQHSGKLITNYSFDDARNFNHHFAAVEINGKWGFIDETGNMVIPADYDVVYDFKNENTVVLKSNKWELINDKGTTIKQLDIDVFLGFENNNGKILKDGVSGILDHSGNINREAIDRAGVISGPIFDDQVSDSAAIKESKLKLNFPTQILQSQISVTAGLIDEIQFQIEKT
jgi:hypothetical protein